MNPADVAQAALPIASADVSLIALFLQAHWIVKAVMIGLLSCSVWVWAIAIDKVFLYSRTKRAMDRFEQAFWSGESIEELYRALSAKPTQSMAACFVAAMREWKRSFESHARSFAGLRSPAKSSGWNAGFSSWRRSAQPDPLWACSAPFGASCRASNRSQRPRTPRWRWWRPVLPRRCLRPQLGSSPQFRRLFSTISSHPR